MQIGRRVAVIVHAMWYEALEGHRVLKDRQLADHPTDLLVATIESDAPAGLWVKPDERFSDFPKSSLFIPWQSIVAAVLLDTDEEPKLRGFAAL
jgi:hypothetical protein